MTKSADGSYAGIGDAAVLAKTGKNWAKWFAILDKAGAAAWPHKEIAVYLHDQCGCPNWWSQMVTVGYEQARGLRVKHQKAVGFSASASKTISVSVTVLFAAWHDPKKLAKWLPEGKKITVRKTTTTKSVRATWIDGTTSIDVQFWSKGDAKSQITVEHTKLGSVDNVMGLKAYWAEAFSRLKKMLEAGAEDNAASALVRPSHRTAAKGRQEQ
jgi:hypothetical protein